jgi:hypothetical protein
MCAQSAPGKNFRSIDHDVAVVYERRKLLEINACLVNLAPRSAIKAPPMPATN